MLKQAVHDAALGRSGGCPVSGLDRRAYRRKADIEDVRLRDLRHTHAIHAVMNSVPVPVVSRLLGHSNVRMTLQYAHLGERKIEAAAERAGQAVAEPMGLYVAWHANRFATGLRRALATQLCLIVQLLPFRQSDKDLC